MIHKLIGSKIMKVEFFTTYSEKYVGESEPSNLEIFYISRQHWFAEWIFESEAGCGYQSGDIFDWFDVPNPVDNFRPVSGFMSQRGNGYTHYARVSSLSSLSVL